MARWAFAVAAAFLLTGSASAGTTTVTITSSPPHQSASDSATFEFTVDPPQNLYCYLDGTESPAGSCASPQTYTGLAPGWHLFRVEQHPLDDASPPVYDVWRWQVVERGPDTSITSGPTGTISTRSATFTFQSDTEGATFECSLDDGAFEGCLSGMSYSDLGLGPHTFAVRAVTDSATDDTPATQSWTISSTPQPPDTQFTSAPSGTVLSRAAIFRFVSVPSGASFECALDDAVFAACRPGQSYSGLVPGLHRFRARAVLDGLADPTPAYRQWTVSEAAKQPPDTVLTDLPGAKTSARRVTLAYRSVPAGGATFQCALDGEPFHACDSTTETPRLSLGEHHFLVRAVRAGAADPTPAAATWRVVRRGAAVWPAVGSGLGAAALLAAAGGFLFHRRRLRVRLRLRPFELEASDQEPPRTCRVPQSHTWRRDCKLRPALRKVESLSLAAAGFDAQEVTGEPIEQLNRAVWANRLRRRRRVLAVTSAVADDLFERTASWTGGATAEVELEAELTGGKLECEFRRYECVPKADASAWDEVEKWRSEAEYKSALTVASFNWPLTREAFADVVGPALIAFVRRVDVPRRQPGPDAPPVLHQ